MANTITNYTDAQIMKCLLTRDFSGIGREFVDDVLTSIKPGAFLAAQNLDKVSLPALKEIRSYAFQDSSIATLDLPWEELESIGHSAFLGATGLPQNLTLSKLTAMSNGAFAGTSSVRNTQLRTVSLPLWTGSSFSDGAGFTNTSLGIFAYCSAMTSFSAPELQSVPYQMKCSLSGNTWSGSSWDGTSKYTKRTQEEYKEGELTTITADFRKYTCVEDSVADHSAYLLGAMNGSKKRYEGLAGCIDYKKAIRIIKDGGYATSSTYVEKICSIIEKYNLTQYDAENTQPDTDNDTMSTFPAVPFTVKVLIDDLNYRSQPSMDGAVKGQTGKGVFTIVEVQDGWGKLKSGAGWIYLENPSYCTVQGAASVTPEEPAASGLPYKVRVSISDLNIRKGPGTNYAKTGKYTGKGEFTIVEEADGQGASKWGLLKSYADKRNGWISLEYAEKM